MLFTTSTMSFHVSAILKKVCAMRQRVIGAQSACNFIKCKRLICLEVCMRVYNDEEVFKMVSAMAKLGFLILDANSHEPSLSCWETGSLLRGIHVETGLFSKPI